MGRMSLEGMLDSEITRRTALEWHLRSNHFPPVPLSMVEPCEQAIDACNEGDSDRQIQLPEQTSWRGHDTAPAWAIVEGHHLDSFLDDLDDDY